MLDDREATTSEIIGYKGDIYRRTDMLFYVKHDDGSTLWQQYEPGKYRLNRDLWQLCYRSKSWKIQFDGFDYCIGWSRW